MLTVKKTRDVYVRAYDETLIEAQTTTIRVSLRDTEKIISMLDCESFFQLNDKFGNIVISRRFLPTLTFSVAYKRYFLERI